MHVTESRITRTRRLVDGTWLVGLSAPTISQEARPGQFVQVRLAGSKALLLPRAFSVFAAGRHCSLTDDTDIELLVRVVGQGTRRLARCAPGERVQLMGALGNAFEVGDHVKHLLLAAGGIGFAPLYFLAAERADLRGDLRIDFFYGARTARELAGREFLEKLPLGRHYVTDDGSTGRKGLVTDAVGATLEASNRTNMLVCACGPPAMLRTVQRITVELDVACLLSLENYMACGTGVCHGCAVNVGTLDQPTYRRVCTDGPVFNAGSVKIVELSQK